MEPDLRGRAAQAAQAPAAGTFRPGLPKDSQDVVRLFAIAARTICAAPKAIEATTITLLSVAQQLVDPERQAALECAQMWQLFARVAQLPKDSLRLEAARAFCRDLDTLAQRLELPPLEEWADLPAYIEEPGYEQVLQGALPSTSQATKRAEPMPIAAVRNSAMALLTASGQPHLSAKEAADLLAVLAAEDRQKLFQQMVGQGELSRSDVNMLVRFLLKGDAIGASDAMLREVLVNIGRFLLR